MPQTGMWRAGGLIYCGGKELASHSFQAENFPRGWEGKLARYVSNTFQNLFKITNKTSPRILSEGLLN
jgi:hypothetical protein